jgi:hypothetical protein
MAIDPTIQAPYFGDMVTIATLNAPVRLMPLIQAISPHCSPAVAIANLFAPSTNTAVILFGSERVSATNYAFSLAASATKNYVTAGGQFQGIPIGDLWMWTTAAATLGIELIP